MRARAFVLLLAIATHAAAAPLDEMQKSFTALVNAGESEAAFAMLQATASAVAKMTSQVAKMKPRDPSAKKPKLAASAAASPPSASAPGGKAAAAKAKPPLEQCVPVVVRGVPVLVLAWGAYAAVVCVLLLALLASEPAGSTAGRGFVGVVLALVAAGVARLVTLDNVAPLVRAWAAWAGTCVVLGGFTQIGAFDSGGPSSATRLAATHSHNKEWKPETKGHLLARGVPEAALKHAHTNLTSEEAAHVSLSMRLVLLAGLSGAGYVIANDLVGLKDKIWVSWACVVVTPLVWLYCSLKRPQPPTSLLVLLVLIALAYASDKTRGDGINPRLTSAPNAGRRAGL